jgi:histone deacetylase 11
MTLTGTPRENAHPNDWPSPRIVYSSHYNIGFFGLERLHPFDSKKYGRAWQELRRAFGRQLKQFKISPPRPVRHAELLAIHSADYLKQLCQSKFVAGVLELPQLKYLPGWAVDWLVLRGMRWATMGTVIAAREAMQHGLAVNLSGGYHHASRDIGHGFSAYADVGIAVHELRRTNVLGDKDKIVYVDLDAHQGNGVCRTFFEDSRVFIYDQYNRNIFPHDVKAQRRIDCDVPIENGCHQADYLASLKARLPNFLDAIMRAGDIRLAIYNAGTDVFVEDQLGGMQLSAEGVLERDVIVLNELVRRKIPTVVVLSGGYSRQSYKLVAQMVAFLLETWGHCVRI